MARRGKYGQLPAASSSLTDTIISIAKQMESQREQNLLDAWKNGGEFEGKPVTDQMVLAFYQNQLKGVSKDDPLYDQYENTLTQTEYSIAESKMSTWYAGSKQDAAADEKMAHFYSGWAKKIPPNSEFYRVLQRDSAQFIRSAQQKLKAAGGGSGGLTKAQIKAKQYADAQQKIYDTYEKPGDYLVSVLTNTAKGNALIGMSDSQDLTKFDPNDPGTMLDILNRINSTPNAPVYYTAQGAVTGADIIKQLKAVDPHFDGHLTVSYIGTAFGNKLVGLNNRLDLAKSTAHKADTTSLTKQIGATNELGREINAWPIEQSYQNARSTWLKTWQDPTATPDQKMAAWNTYRTTLVNLATSKTHPPDQNTYTRLMAEVNGDGNVDSLAESFAGLGPSDHSSLTGGSKGDIADTHASVENLMGQQQAVATGQAVWAQGTTDSSGVFHPGAGTEIGAAHPADVQAASPDGAILVYVTQAGGQPIPVWVSGKSVVAKVLDSNGNEIPSSTPNDMKVATAYDVTVDGKTTTLYGYKSSAGVTMYTTDAPWGSQVQAHDTGSQVQLTVTLNAVPDAKSIGNDPNFTVTYDPTDLNHTGTPHITVNPNAFVLNETDPVRAMAGPDPNTDSLSPSIALHMGDQGDMAQLSTNGGFLHQVDTDLRLASGGQIDPKTGYVVGGNPDIYNAGAQQAGLALRQVTGSALETRGGMAVGDTLFFGRANTRGTFEVAGAGAQVYRDNLNQPEVPVNTRSGSPITGPVGTEANRMLPSDQVRGTAAFGGLASLFQPGTNNLVPPGQTDRQGGLTITTPQSLKVPSAPRVNTVPQRLGTPTTAPGSVMPAPLVAPAAANPPGITDSITPIPGVTPAPTPVTPFRPSGGDVTTGTGGATTPTTSKQAPKPLSPRTGMNPL